MMKDECGGKQIVEYAAPGPKVYSFTIYEDKSEKKNVKE